MNKVYAMKCEDYAQAGECLTALLALMGGMERFVKAGECMVLKPNLLAPAHPEKAITTHPAVVAAVAEQVIAAGGSALLAECPGAYKHSTALLKRAYEACGMTAVEERGAQLNYDVSYEEVFFPEGRLMRHFEVMTPIRKGDGVINVCKLKTHMFMNMTGAVKNLFGVIPGLSKAGYHAKLQDKEQFAGMLLDLARYVAPRLSVMDAVLGMEGEGPGASGTPRPIGWLLAAENPLALDVVAAEMMGLAQAYNPLLLAAKAQGLEPNCVDAVELVGATWEELRIPRFRLPEGLKKGMMFVRKVPGPLSALAKSAFTQMPKVAQSRCIGCGICRDSCPVKAISITEKGKANISAGKCIRCYCCHELCPHKAVDVRRGFLSRISG